jgi:DNA-binding response OmpR family regulator
MAQKRLKILILDDDAETLALLATRLADEPYSFEFVGSGCAAVSAIFEAYDLGDPFDAMILDCALPRLDGFTIARIVRLAETTEVAPRARIGFFTAFTQTVEQSTLLAEVGADAYWRKPEDVVELPQRMAEWLRKAAPAAASG